MKTIAISIDEEALRRIDRLARELAAAEPARAKGARGANRSKVVRAALQEYLARVDRQRQEGREREIFARNRRRLRLQAAALVEEQAKP